MTSIVLESGRTVSVIDRVVRALRRKGFVMLTTAARLQSLVQSTFEQQRDPWGRPWAPLKQSTLNIRARRGNSSTDILLDSYNLYQSVEQSYGEDFAQVNYPGAEEYAWVHQFGNPLNTLFGRGNYPVPARMFMPIKGTGPRLDLPNDWVRELVKPMEDHLRNQIR